MTDLTGLRMNVAALKRVDPYVKDILETATHVALYTFNAVNNEWEKTNIEGALFVYSRNGEPYNSVLIMNRLNTNNLVEPVTQGLDLQLQEPFLLYRNSRCNIYGIWFYDKEECVRIGAMLNKLIKESEENRKTFNKPAVNVKKESGPNASNVDIFSMLSKAQEDFNTNRNNNSSGGGIKERHSTKSPLGTPTTDDVSGPLAAPLGPDVTSQSVMDFFAKAKVNTGHFKAGDQPTPGGTVANESKPLLARLMSHPAAHTVEHIEKQHRSITPQPATQQQTTPTTILTANSACNATASNRTKKRNRTASQQDSMIPTPASITQEILTPMNQNTADTNGTTGFLRIQSPTNASTSTLTNHQASDIIGPSNSNPLASLFAHASATTASEDIITPPTLSGRGSAPALIPPVMFAAPSPPEPLTRPLEPLTKNQFLRAFNYLLRSDPDFINKLHEAYVKSFGEILS
ncbi:mRNA-decapping enzyme 1A [Bombus vosnesenskii]|uniref:mRNA-decapping enzyme 1A n=1 Tax=Bombus vosnesenskii TaxID=207650 RepID=A0A6J3JZU3_9HYME|nr:mRNA-decapping enzyme 1A [Bombus vancouverensis nearcticus]XP_033346388.1 mRNA-decapping enzyme 1A [Bombus vosnesenskii]XP_050487929.1 mRNA-decapping enzyme 1A [Bombus huntii]